MSSYLELSSSYLELSSSTYSPVHILYLLHFLDFILKSRNILALALYDTNI